MSLSVTQIGGATGVTVAVPGSISGPAGPAGSRSGQIVTWCLAFPTSADVVADGYVLQLAAPYAATVAGVDYFSPVGSFTASLLIGATPVQLSGGVTSFTAASPTLASLAAQAANTVAIGNQVSLVISSAAGGAKGGCVSVRLTVT